MNSRPPRSTGCRPCGGPAQRRTTTFASVRSGKSYVSLYLLVADTYPDALEETSASLLKRRSGKATFNFPQLDDEMSRDLERLLARLYDRYRADHADPQSPRD
jgi:hypothetical protein